MNHSGFLQEMEGNLFNGECPVERVDERSALVDRRILLELYIGVVNVHM